MRAIMVIPGHVGDVRIEDLPEPVPGPGDLLVRGLLPGICGTDKGHRRGRGLRLPPPGEERPVIGHESLGTVLEAPSGFRKYPFSF